MQKAVIDRIVDGAAAVLLVGEKEERIVCPLKDLPAGAREGLWLLVKIEDGKLVQAELDEAETKAVKKRLQAKLERLRQRGPRLN